MPVASEEMASRLRERIVRGRLKPGIRLPARLDLIGELETCAGTLQAAVDQLVREGFLQVGPRKKGTRVAEHPPHLSRYRLLFPYGPDDWGQFWHALEAAARQRASPTREFLPFYGLAGHRDIEEYRTLVNEVQTRRVAGLIFASSAGEFAGTPLLDHAGLPRVAIADDGQLPGMPKVHVDLDSFMAQAIGCLVAQGRRRIALLCASSATGVADKYRRAMAKRGLRCRTAWEQCASQRNPLAARHVVELLMQPGRPERPDGLIVADDNLLTAASNGLVDAGVQVPEDLQVVAATNFPNLVPPAVPVTRIGYDIPALLDLLVLRLEQVRRGERAPEVTLMPATLEPGETAARPSPPSVRHRKKEEP